MALKALKPRPSEVPSVVMPFVFLMQLMLA
jgi:hypothetical protein